MLARRVVVAMSMLTISVSATVGVLYFGAVSAQAASKKSVASASVVEKKKEIQLPKIKPGELIVQFKDNASSVKFDTIKNFLQARGIQAPIKSLKRSSLSDRPSGFKLSVKANQSKFDQAKKRLSQFATLKFSVSAENDSEKKVDLKNSLNPAIRARFDRLSKKDPKAALDLIADAQTKKVKKELEKNQNVKAVFYSIRRSVKATPNDTLFPKQWSLNNTGQSYPLEIGGESAGNTDSDIDMPEAWDLDQSNRGEDLVVGITDTGIDYTHPDIVNNLWVNQGEIPTGLQSNLDTDNNNSVSSTEILNYCQANCADANNDEEKNFSDIFKGGLPVLIDNQDQDNNGYTDDIIGWDFFNNTNNPIDTYGHGTHVAGTIAAQDENSLGVAGVAANAKVLSARLSSDDGYFADDVTLADAIIYSSTGDVMNMSWGGPSMYPDLASDPIYNAIEIAVYNNSVPVAAAGNEYSDVELGYFGKAIPAGYPNVIAVAASDSKDMKADFSNYGPKVDVIAPGVDILSLNAKNNLIAQYEPSAVYQDNYLVISGTSMASPHVAGLALLIKGNHPNYKLNDVRQLFRTQSDDLSGQGFSDNFGFGRINAQKVLNPQIQGSFPVARFVGLNNYSNLSGKLVIKGEVSGSSATSWKLELRKAGESQWNQIATGNPATGEQILIPQFNTATLSKNGIYYFRLSSGTDPLRAVDIRKIIVGNPGQFTVNSTSDAPDAQIDGVCETVNSGECTLRAAIAEANDIPTEGSPFGKNITFNIPENDPGYFAGGPKWVISPQTPLPTITANDLTLQGSRIVDPNNKPVLSIELNGSSQNGGNGLEVSGEFVMVSALAIHSFPQNGIRLNQGSLVALSENMVGTDITGLSTDLGNGENGIEVDSAQALYDGYFGPNLVQGNKGNGIKIMGQFSQGGSVSSKLVQNQQSGLFAQNTSQLYISSDISKNSQDGVTIADSTMVDISGTIIDNTKNGVSVTGQSEKVAIYGQKISGNGLLGIDLGNNGITKNDQGDQDTGPNNYQNFPIIDQARIVGTSIEVSGFSRPKSIINFYLSDNDASGYGEGKTAMRVFVEGAQDSQYTEGNDLDTTTGSYNLPGGADLTNRFKFKIPLPIMDYTTNTPVEIKPGGKITATASSMYVVNDQFGSMERTGDTSEFSPQASITGCAPFPDVKATHVFAPYICSLKEDKVVSGFADGKFYPDNAVTRGQMAKFVRLGLFGESVVDTSCGNFPDVPASDTFYKDIMTLKCKGVVSGFADGKFKSTLNVTRGQSLKFIIGGARVALNDTSFFPVYPETKAFPDVPNTNTFYEFIMAASSHQIASGYPDGKFMPDQTMTRGGMSKWVDIARSKMPKLPPSSSSSSSTSNSNSTSSTSSMDSSDISSSSDSSAVFSSVSSSSVGVMTPNSQASSSSALASTFASSVASSKNLSSQMEVN